MPFRVDFELEFVLCTNECEHADADLISFTDSELEEEHSLSNATDVLFRAGFKLEEPDVVCGTHKCEHNGGDSDSELEENDSL